MFSSPTLNLAPDANRTVVADGASPAGASGLTSDPRLGTTSANGVQPIRVLVVEDHEEDYRYLVYLLRKNTFATYKVEWAPSYEAGIAALKRGEHDVGLFDYLLGGRTGVDLLREAKTLGGDIPIILLTGHDSPEIDQQASAAGAADYLCKVGLNTTQLERAIRYALRQAAMLSVVKKSQSQLELFMRSVPCAVCIRDEDGELLFQNERFEKHFNHVELTRANAHAPGLDPWPYVDGHHHWLVNSFPMVDAHGRRLQGLAAIDITERVRAEENLRRTTRLLNGILSSLPVIVSSVDGEGTFLESRGRGLVDIGLGDGDLVGTNVFDLYPKAAAEIKKAIQGGTVNFIWEIPHEGRTHYFDNYFRYDEASGKGAVGFSVNVTARVEAETERNRQNLLLAGIMKNLPVIAGRIDASGRVVEARGEGLARRGIHHDELEGRMFAQIYPQSREALEQALRGGSANFTLSRRSDDDEWHADFYVSFDTETGSGATFFGRDITERRMLERKILNISDAEQQRIGADLHDGLGQHLTGIACMATALRDRLKTQELPEMQQADVIAGLVNEAISHTRALARGLSPVQLEETGLQSALEDLTFQVQLIHGVECRFRPNGPPPNCDHDMAVHLYRITQEAINNAIRHGDSKRIVVSLEKMAKAGSYRLLVEDDGAGFDAAEPRSEPGVGLRLMNYRAAVIGGSFSVTSSPGHGARAECTFTVSLPSLPSHETKK